MSKRSLLLLCAPLLFVGLTARAERNIGEGTAAGKSASSSIDVKAKVLRSLEITDPVTMQFGEVLRGYTKKPETKGSAKLKGTGQVTVTVGLTSGVLELDGQGTALAGKKIPVKSWVGTYTDPAGAVKSLPFSTNRAQKVMLPDDVGDAGVLLTLDASVEPPGDAVAGSYSGKLTLDMIYD